MSKLLTIGMPCYNDYSGAWFTLQTLRMKNHPGIEYLVIDTFGDERIKGFVAEWGGDDCRYICQKEPYGTGPAKNLVFENAIGEFVLCIDSHVLFMPGSIEKLCAFLNTNASFDGLAYGTLIYDNLIDCATEMEPVWRGHMWGIWGSNKKITELPAEPFDIWGHGGGCFLSRRNAWLGFNRGFRGFGGEEGYLAEKYRKHGKPVICLPFLRWIHRFGHPNGTGYKLHIDDRIRNYLIGFQELGLDTAPIYDHFGKEQTERVANTLRNITIKSFNGIGDLLYATPSFSAIKKKYPNSKITVNTNYPELLDCNPYVDEVGTDKNGVFLGYPDIVHEKQPTQHHIISDWEIICKEYNIETDTPKLRPEIYFDLPKREGGIIVQTESKNTFSGKKIWPHAKQFAETYGFSVVPHFDDVKELVRFIASAQLVVCAEGAIHHIAVAVGTPAVVILGGLHRANWVGYESQHYIETNCELRDQCYNPHPCKHANKMCCMNISPQQVYKKVLDCIKAPIKLFPKHKKLNLGSGEMLLKDWTNFDAQAFKRHGISTNAFGLIENITQIYEPNTFDEVLSAHVLEHMLEPDAKKMLRDIHTILKPGGKAVIEGPDFLGAQKVAGDNVQQAIRWIMSHTTHPKKWGDHWYHKSAWTKAILNGVMNDIGFEVVHVGIGLTHGMGERDFRVEGIKRA